MRSFWLGSVAWPVFGSALLISSCIADGDSTLDPVRSAPADAGERGEGLGGDAGGGETPVGGGGFAGASDVTPGSGGSAGKAGKGGSAGSSDSAGEGGSSPEGGAGGGQSGAPAGGTTSGQGGDAATGGVANEGGASPSGGQGQGGGGSEGPPPLTICLRLPGFAADSFDVTQAYRAETTRDCRISWVTRLYLDVDDEATFLNRLIRWNIDLWGCSGNPPDDFGLLYEEVALTSADADALIEIYMQAAITELELSAKEIDEMRAALEHLADRVVERETDEFTDSHCVAASASEAEPG
jgi:hypothetical protein